MKQLIRSRGALGTRVSVAAALVLAGLATFGLPTSASAAPQPVYGLFSLTAGAQTGTKAATGTYFRMLQPGGNTYVSNPDSRAADKTYTILKPGTDGGLYAGDRQGQPEPAFSSTGDALSSRIIAPEAFFGSKLSVATNQVDPQYGLATPAVTIAVDGTKLTGNLSAFAVTWNNQHLNQGAPKPSGHDTGPTPDVSGTYNPSTKAYTLTWRSPIIGGPFNKFIGEWHLAGTFTPDPVITTDTFLPTGLVGKAYSATLRATGGKGSYTWSLSPGSSLPPGLALSTTGKITGTPVGPGTWYVGGQVTDSTKPRKLVATRVLYLKVDPLVVNDLLLPSGLLGKVYPTTKLTARGGKATLVWTVSKGVLPAGLKLSAGGSLSGTPTAAGLHLFTVQVADASKPKNIATRDFGIVVDPLTVTTTELPAAVVGKAVTSKLTARGGKGTLVWTIPRDDLDLPPGLKLSTGGSLSGTPTTAGTSVVEVQVADASTPKNIATRVYVYTVEPFAVATSSSGLPDGTVGTTYPTTKLTANGGKGTLTWTVAQGALPAGLNVSTAGSLSGKPTTAGTYTFTAQVADSSSPKNVAMREFTITIR